jgi:hypothetical protein
MNPAIVPTAGSAITVTMTMAITDMGTRIAAIAIVTTSTGTTTDLMTE